MKCKSNTKFLSWYWGFFSDEQLRELGLDMVPSPLHVSSDLLVLKLLVYLHTDRFSSQYFICKVQNTGEEQDLKLSRWRRVRWLWWKSWFTAPGFHWSNLTEIRDFTPPKPRAGSGSAEWWTFAFIQKIKWRLPCVPVFQLSPAHLTWAKQPLHMMTDLGTEGLDCIALQNFRKNWKTGNKVSHSWLYKLNSSGSFAYIKLMGWGIYIQILNSR